MVVEADFTISPMRPDEYDACIDIAAEAFTTNNPMVMHLGVTLDEYKPLARQMCPQKRTVPLDIPWTTAQYSATWRVAAYCAPHLSLTSPRMVMDH